jgi:hypothetical protein
MKKKANTAYKAELLKDQLVANMPKAKAKAKKKDTTQPLSKQPVWMHLSPCASRYAISLEAPWLPLENVCVPITPSLPSRKCTAFRAGGISIGTAGVGFITFSPNAGIFNDVTSAYITGAAFAGTATATSGTGVGAIGLTNSPFASGTISDISQFSARIVSAGVRVRYTGKELDRAGSVYLLEAPGHADLSAGYTITSLGAFRENTIVAPSRGWIGATWHPQTAAELSFAMNPLATFPLAIIITGTAGTTYDFDLTVNFEVQGTKAANDYTVSEEDNQGFGYVDSAARLARQYLKPTAGCAVTIAEAASRVKQGLDLILPMAATFAGTAGASVIGFRMALDAMRLPGGRILPM